VEDVTTSDLVYAAATIDCEGTIGIMVQREPSRNGGVLQFFYAIVSVTNTDSILTGWLQEMFGGNTGVRNRNENHKPSYYWNVSTSSAYAFIEQVFPYLKLKWQQAELALELRDRIELSNGKRLTSDEIEARMALKEAMNALNKKGVPIGRKR